MGNPKIFQCLAVSLVAVISACDGQGDVDGKSMMAPAEADLPLVESSPEGQPHDEGQTAEDGHPAENSHGRLEAHEHGHARLAAAVDGSRLTFTFEAPLASLVGFEHAPDTPEQQAQIDSLKDAFVTPDSMVSINSEARCLPVTTSSGTRMSGGHGGLAVEHVYDCERPARIAAIEFLKMKAYPALQSIEAVFISQTNQSASQLGPGNTVLEVR